MNRTTIGVIVAVIFILGAGAIVYFGRPVMKISDTQYTQNQQQTTTTNPTASNTTYTLNDVAQHNTESNCWSVVNGNVYDLSSWVSRHPGGSRPIIGMCGKDGTSSYTRKHGSESRPASALSLLKIGILAQ